MRISDWSSDVCSSDLADADGAMLAFRQSRRQRKAAAGRNVFADVDEGRLEKAGTEQAAAVFVDLPLFVEIARLPWNEAPQVIFLDPLGTANGERTEGRARARRHIERHRHRLLVMVDQNTAILHLGAGRSEENTSEL